MFWLVTTTSGDTRTREFVGNEVLQIVAILRKPVDVTEIDFVELTWKRQREKETDISYEIITLNQQLRAIYGIVLE